MPTITTSIISSNIARKNYSLSFLLFINCISKTMRPAILNFCISMSSLNNSTISTTPSTTRSPPNSISSPQRKRRSTYPLTSLSMGFSRNCISSPTEMTLFSNTPWLACRIYTASWANSVRKSTWSSSSPPLRASTPSRPPQKSTSPAMSNSRAKSTASFNS